MFPTVGVLSGTSVFSASHPAETPALVTPFHVFATVCLLLPIRRQGFALPVFVMTIVGSRT
jgi:hypothetical protein